MVLVQFVQPRKGCLLWAISAESCSQSSAMQFDYLSVWYTEVRRCGGAADMKQKTLLFSMSTAWSSKRPSIIQMCTN